MKNAVFSIHGIKILTIPSGDVGKKKEGFIS